MTHSVHTRMDARSATAFAEEERQGMMLAAKVRTLALLLVLFWQIVDNPNTGASYFYGLLEVFIFVLLGALQYLCAKHRFYIHRLSYIFVAIDCLLLALVFSFELPPSDSELPPAIAIDTARFLYFFLFLMQAAFSFRPALVIWSGICIFGARTGMWLWFISQPETYTNLDLEEQTVEAWITAGSDLNFLFLGFAAQELLIVLILTAGLAVVVGRSRKLVQNRLVAERTRASLARYFSPNVADTLSRFDQPFATAREQEVAVLFADIMGFTKLCENSRPKEVVDLLRGYHDRLGKAVFDNNGTLDKYIGDGLMATFGTPEPSANDAENALICAFEMLSALDQWNTERQAAGLARVNVGIGLHWGPVVAGDIGNDRRLEYSVIGDTVNIASRLEHLTRDLKTSLVVSDLLMKEIHSSERLAAAELRRLVPAGERQIRGRASGVDVWVLSDRDT